MISIGPKHLSLLEDFQARYSTGLLTLMFTDMAGSTKLKSELGDVLAGAILQKHNSVVRNLLKSFPAAREVSTAGDSFFLVFDSPSNAAIFALRLHRALRELSKTVGHPVRVRVGIHVGEVFVEHGETEGKVQNYSGIPVDTCARIMSVCEPERLLLTRFAFDNARHVLSGKPIEGVGPLQWLSHGLFELKGVTHPLEICEIFDGKESPSPIADSEKGKRLVSTPLLDDTEFFVRKSKGRPKLKSLIRWHWKEVAIAVGLAWLVAFLVGHKKAYLAPKFANLSYDLAYYLRDDDPPQSAVPKEATIIYMDDESHKALNQPTTAPWDHAIHAQMIERLAAAGAKAVVMDIVFDKEQTNSAALVAAAKKTRLFVGAAEESSGPEGSLNWRVVGPFQALRTNSVYGLVEAFPGRARKLYRPRGETIVPMLSAVLAEQFSTNRYANRGALWLNFYGKPNTIPNLSYIDANNASYNDLFRDKIVFVGAKPSVGYTGNAKDLPNARDYDEFETPYSSKGYEKMAGVEVLATATLNLLRNETVTELDEFRKWMLYLFCPIFVAILVTFLRPLWAFVAAGFIALTVAIVSMDLAWRWLTWYPWAVIALVQIPAIICCNLAIRADRLLRQKRRLEDALEKQQSAFESKSNLLRYETKRPTDIQPVE